jgi:GntR family transcriptional regulator
VSGDLAEGDRLPPIATIADEWDVATATAAKAISQLQVERLVRTSPRGTFVVGESRASSPRDRILRSRRRGKPESGGEVNEVTSAAIVRAPVYVAELFGGPDDHQLVVRREWVTSEMTTTTGGARRVRLSVSWFPAAFADAVPDLLSTDSSHMATLDLAIEKAAGPLRHCRDFVEAREADAREAGHLELPVGAPVLAGAFLRWPGGDPDGPAEYGEYVIPPRRVVSWEYELPDPDEG